MNTSNRQIADNIIKPILVESPNYGTESKWFKLRRKLHGIFLSKIANTPLQFRLYPSYWHYVLSSKKEDNLIKKNNNYKLYLSQIPNYGAGIGHQLANWNSGLYFAKFFNVNFAHFPFSTSKWESLLGFGEGEITVNELINNKIKVVKLPRFDSENNEEVNLVKKIIDSYKGNNILFKLEQDQGYMRQFETSNILSAKFFNAISRKKDNLISSKETFNIAIHIRRRMKIETNEVWISRGLENQYYANILNQVLQILQTSKKVNIYLFSQGKVEDFPEFNPFENIIFCTAMNAMDSFVEMANADILISSKSSFSYKPALISKGIKIFPETFWHGHPQTPDFIPANNTGEFDHTLLNTALSNYNTISV